MARLKSIATGNLTAAATWGKLETTSYSNNETTTIALTTAYSGGRSAAFTTGAVTISHIGLKLGRIGTTGTLSVHIADNATHTEVAGTLVTINTADLHANERGWCFFKLASPVTLLAATAYEIEAKTSSSNQVRVYSTSTTVSTLSRCLVTTTTQAPVAGDDMIVSGEFTGTGTSNSYTVTMNETATTDYGSASTLQYEAALYVCNLGTLTWGTTASTNYFLKLSGNLNITGGGTYNMGTVATPCPRTSTMELLFDCVADTDFGMNIMSGATVNVQGQSRTASKNFSWTLLTADVAINGTTFNVQDDTGWLDNDVIAIASTSRTTTEAEKGALNGNAGASSFTVDSFGGSGGGVANSHLGSSPMQAEIVNLTRSVKIHGTSSTICGYITTQSQAASINVDFDWVELYYLGGNAAATTATYASRRGVVLDHASGTVTFTHCSRYDSTGTLVVTTGSLGFFFSATVSINIGSSLDNCVAYNIQNALFSVGGTTNYITMTSCVGMLSVSGNIFTCNTGSSSIISCRASSSRGSQARGFVIGDINPIALGTFTGLVSHSTGDSAINWYVSGATLSNSYIWRGNAASAGGLELATHFDSIFDNVNIWGCNGEAVMISGNSVNVTFTNCQFSGDTTFSTATGINVASSIIFVALFESCVFDITSGIYVPFTTQAILIATGAIYNYVNITCVNCKFPSTVITNQNILSITGFISSQKHNQTTNSHRTWKRQGNLVIETTTVHSGTRSLAMSPLTATASDKLISNSFLRSVSNGNTLTPTIWIYKSAGYVGSQPRLILKRNDALGITTDTIIATYSSSTGSWNSISGTTPAATDNGVMEFVVDCDGSAGTIYVDDFSV